MNSSPTSTGRTPPNPSSPSFTLRTASCGSARPGSLSELRAFEFDWPGSKRWGVVMDQIREHFDTLEQWWALQRSGAGKLGISPPPEDMKCSAGVGFATGWTLLS